MAKKQDKLTPFELADFTTFDLDGTICDPRDGIVRCFQHALERVGCALPPEAELLKHIGPPLHASPASLLDTADRELIMRAVVC